jgi:hypothetical protein
MRESQLYIGFYTSSCTLLRHEGLTGIEVGELGASDNENHVGNLLASRRHKAYGCWCQRVLCPGELRTGIDACMGRITALDFDDVDALVQVEDDEMAWEPCLLVMTNPCVRLIGARTPILHVIECDSYPSSDGGKQRPEHQHREHSQAEQKQGMELHCCFDRCSLWVGEL